MGEAREIWDKISNVSMEDKKAMKDKITQDKADGTFVKRGNGPFGGLFVKKSDEPIKTNDSDKGGTNTTTYIAMGLGVLALAGGVTLANKNNKKKK